MIGSVAPIGFSKFVPSIVRVGTCFFTKHLGGDNTYALFLKKCIPFSNYSFNYFWSSWVFLIVLKKPHFSVNPAFSIFLYLKAFWLTQSLTWLKVKFSESFFSAKNYTFLMFFFYSFTIMFSYQKNHIPLYIGLYFHNHLLLYQ